MSVEWLNAPVAKLDETVRAAAEARQQQLTKPPGSLGRLETVAIELAALQGREAPSLEQISIVIFAADHGVADEGVSAFPQAVTTEMIRNFARGGAAISVLARELGARLEVVDVGAVIDPGPLEGVISQRVAAGSSNLAVGAAMSTEQLASALSAGRDAVARAVETKAELFVGGDMGIANTTAATAIAAALLKQPAARLVGPGTGLDSDGVQHKTQVIEQALLLHTALLEQPFEVLRCLGGFEIAALAGAYVAAAQVGLPVLVDGFIATSAALAATHIVPEIRPWLLFAHASAEPGHLLMVEALSAKPLVDLDLRLGEGSGAAVALPLLRMAVALHNNMATFAEADVSEEL
ncbi:nicotinate-nucleotide--dimethylbenzimidazole phosphoribosyltransferase [Solemya pervernicosa gill symbiont]|uniref:Nicotinate-nucleotide--dimethylbenzimidazole phosphoribosyltransferase n=2 Tax=Gammaproteobacteria incertae sedis TaxID=118884 RepID=A0A1T2L878_9GAMM|nr:nicotinate-nucleotide--dimethylbenzimidazole phosphoribosyltransferase [Candidatus Reidiella endopervernicosa]OOZ41309.1 nicotinate-nucleotide--dimethylbenzimidazole phosphoribosyltransferase [Solemya pervernicosa gill symbiont]QKQ27694.1 nicotinate-nucleotide--dimethylbenzimidazole phosphoribosyltransferase [Candidatus Reidiella endopervernicosa]